MLRYIIGRLLQALVVLVVLSFVSFYLMGLMPGDPLDIACNANPHCTAENLAQMKATLGLDQPIHIRYLKWFGDFLTGDFGYSRTYQKPVVEILLPRLANTFFLSLLSLLLSLLIAVPLGVLTSLKQNSKFDYGVNFIAFAGVSSPSFWLALMLIMIFSVWLGWFPAGGTYTIETSGELEGVAYLIDRLKYLILPTLSLSIMTIASWTRFTRASMLETMRRDYIKTARAKGLSFGRVVLAHGLRNALIPLVTVITVSMGLIFSGAVITETVFSYQGAGYLMFQSIQASDFNVAMCSFVVTCVSVLIMNLIADICYCLLDPRISYS